MIAKLLISHGSLAHELLESARKIVGDVSTIEALSLPWQEDCDHVEARLRAKVEELDDGEGVLVLTDLHGATPCNAATRLLEPGKVEIVTGMNLAMVVRLATPFPDSVRTVSELADWIEEKGRAGIRAMHPAARSGALR